MRRLVLSVLSVSYLCPAALWGNDASRILSQAKVKGGLVVHVGCGDGFFRVEPDTRFGPDRQQWSVQHAAPCK